jgi:8-oxo-dGTP pyrophosphatase MutT (NUDIX family)
MAGARFVAFHAVEEQRAAEYAPRFALMLPRASGSVLLAYSRTRRVWELPGGLIDPGETPREAAIRELLEETSCVGSEVRWLGIVEVQEDKSSFGAVLSCRIKARPSGFSNEETVALQFWNPQSWPAPLGQSDEELLRRLG